MAKTLEKDREYRYQATSDLLLDLKQLKRQMEIRPRYQAKSACTGRSFLPNYFPEISHKSNRKLSALPIAFTNLFD